MTPELFLGTAINPALRLLPARMDSLEARAMMVAIALQESGIKHRAQIGGPARGYFQFEQGGGVKGVLTHPSSMAHIQDVLVKLDYDPDSDAAACYVAIQHNDILAAAFARLLLYTTPDRMPEQGEQGKGWAIYLKAWRPGKPKPATWPKNFATAWQIVLAT